MTDQLTYDHFIKKKTPLNDLAKRCHEASYYAGWWHNPETGEEYPTEGFDGAMTIATKIALIHSEVSEALEGHRRSSMDDKLPHRTTLEVELVDVIIRVLDLAHKKDLDMDGALEEKMEFNSVRPDHKVAQRKAGGKLY